jgi:hypothetical protein
LSRIVDKCKPLLLGGNIIFLQAVSLMGYCLFPLNVAVLFMLMSDNKVYRSFLAFGAVAWSSWQGGVIATNDLNAERSMTVTQLQGG